MKKLLFLGTILLCASNTFAIELEKGKKKEQKEVLVQVCKTVHAIDQDGEIVASASCCKSFPQSAPTGQEAVVLSIQLYACADNKLEETLNGN